MTGAGAAAAIAAAIANAIKASGAIVEVEPETFTTILSKERGNRPLVIMSKAGVFKANYRYLTAHRGFIFTTKCSEPLMLPGNVDLISAGKIWTPD
jgi:hypothetical protein